MNRSARLLAPYLRRQWHSLAVAAVASIVTAVAEVARPFPLKIVIDRLLGEHGGQPFSLDSTDLSLVVFAAGLVVAIALCDAGASYLVDVRLQRAGERIVHDLRVAVYDHLQRLSLSFHERRPTGDLVTRVTGDVNAVGSLFSDALGTITTSLLLLVGMAAVTVWIDPVMALATFAMAPLLAWATVRSRRRLKSVARRQRATEGEIASLAGEALGSMRVVKALAGERYEGDRITRRSEEVRRAGIEAARIEGRFTGVIDVTGAVASAIVLGLGIFRVAAGHLTVGDLVVVNSYSRRIYRPLRDIARQGARITRAMARGDRIAEVLASDEVPEEEPDAYSGPRARGDVELVDVTFAYPAGPAGPGRGAAKEAMTGPRALDGVSLRFAAGQRTAVVGPSGAGKSTVASLVARFYDPTDGRVLIDGRDSRACALAWVRAQVGLVLQDSVLFSGTVDENIAYGTDADFDAVIAAAKAADAHGFISALPAGYDTVLGPWGVGLSGGQRQRIAIARTLLRDPPILILDEPTTGLDAQSEADVLASLDVLMRGRTVVMITHSLALAGRADRVVVLEGGRVTQTGTPEALLGEEGAFRALATIQGLVDGPAAGEPAEAVAAAPPAVASPAAEPLTAASLPEGTVARREEPAPRPAALPEDDRLPRLPMLLDAAAMGPVLRRTLGPDRPPWPDVRVHCLRYKPGTNLVVHYLVGLDAHWFDATAMIAADRNLAKRAAKPENLALARQVDGRSPAASPLSYDEPTGALVQWLPLDIQLPALALPPQAVRRRLRSAGLTVYQDSPVLLAYRPRRRGVLRLGDHVLKVYADRADYERSVRGLESAAAVTDVRTPVLEAAFDDLMLTAQTVLPGARVDSPVAVAAEAGRLLAAFHACPVEGMEDLPPSNQLERAGRSAALASVVVPALAPRISRLIADLERLQPDLPLVRAHGDFHAGQLLEGGDAAALIDLDEACRAPAALDVANYAAHLVRGAEPDRDTAFGCLERVVEGYGTRPDGLAWYMATAVLRRAPFPFRFLDERWDEGIAAQVEAAEAAMRL